MEWKADKDIVVTDRYGNKTVVGRRKVAFPHKWQTQVKIFEVRSVDSVEGWSLGPQKSGEEKSSAKHLRKHWKGLHYECGSVKTWLEEADVWFVQDKSEK